MSRLRGFAAVGAMFASSFTGAACSGDNTHIGEPKPFCETVTDSDEHSGTPVFFTNYALETSDNFNSKVDAALQNPSNIAAFVTCKGLPQLQQLVDEGFKGEYQPRQVNTELLLPGRQELVRQVCVVVAVLGEVDSSVGLVPELSPSGEPVFVAAC